MLTFNDNFTDLTAQRRDVSSSKATVRRLHRVTRQFRHQVPAKLSSVASGAANNIASMSKSNMHRKLRNLFDPVYTTHGESSPYKSNTNLMTNNKGKPTGDFMISLPTISGVYTGKDVMTDGWDVNASAVCINCIGLLKNAKTGSVLIGVGVSSPVSFSNHSLERFLQRADNNSVYDMFNEMLEADSNAEMLTSAIGQYISIPTKQGIFFGEMIDEYGIMIKTFVDNSRLFENQITLANVISSRLNDIRAEYMSVKTQEWITHGTLIRQHIDQQYATHQHNVPDNILASVKTRQVVSIISKRCTSMVGLNYNEDDFSIFAPHEAIRDYEE